MAGRLRPYTTINMGMVREKPGREAAPQEAVMYKNKLFLKV